MSQPEPAPNPRPIQWESFYRDYRKPGYIPGYEIQVQLGAGAFGIVFKATKESIGKPYAIKFLKVDDVETKNAVMRELDAVRYFAQIDHPNLVAIEDMGEVDGIPYIVMAFAGDDTLRRRIDTGELDRDASMRLFEQTARGVQALHEHSLVHFDIKPANVYLKGDVARIGDYGLSKLVTDSRNSLSMGRGTPYYMAPELLKRKGDKRSDIYALGVVLYEMLTGQPPFQGDSEWEILRKHEEAEVEFPASIDDVSRAVIERAMQKHPDDRFESVAEMIEALGGSIPEPPRPRRTRPAIERHGRMPAHGDRSHSWFRRTMLLTMLGFTGLAFLWMTMGVRDDDRAHATAQSSQPVPIERAAKDRFRDVAEQLSVERHAQALAALNQAPDYAVEDGKLAEHLTVHLGDYLEPVAEELESLGTTQGFMWAALLRTKGDLAVVVENRTHTPNVRGTPAQRFLAVARKLDEDRYQRVLTTVNQTPAWIRDDTLFVQSFLAHVGGMLEPLVIELEGLRDPQATSWAHLLRNKSALPNLPDRPSASNR